MIRYTAAALAALALVSFAEAGKYNTKLSVGDPAPAWTGLPGVDGKSHSLADLKDKDVVVMVITCNHCPVAQAYQERIIDFTKKYATPENRLAVVAINVNNIPEDRLPRMKERARQKGFPFSYLYDESQQVGREYGATVTPEFYVLNKDRKIAYMGSMDDNMNEGKVKHHYLEDAVNAVLKGEEPATAETRPFGCSVKYESASR